MSDFIKFEKVLFNICFCFHFVKLAQADLISIPLVYVVFLLLLLLGNLGIM